MEDRWSSTANDGYWFNLQFGQAVEQARRGCELMRWLVTLRRSDTWSGSYLRAFFTHNSLEQMVLDWVDNIDDHTDELAVGHMLTICAESGDPAASKIATRPPNLHPASKASMDQARRWIKSCIETHEDCPKPSAEAAVPRRLLQIRKPRSRTGREPLPRVRLLETFETPTLQSRKRYAALSYCWGGDQDVKLTRSSLSTWYLHLPFADLPQTIKDAIAVTMELGLGYLWVDALCIIQDDDADKTQELARMGDIYEGSYVTLLAARSPTVRLGFLHSRRVPGERGFCVPFQRADGQLGSVVLWRGRDLDVEQEPTARRAWCLQEYVLSPRVLEFGTHQTRWRCGQNKKGGDAPPESDGWVTFSMTDQRYRHTSDAINGCADWKALAEGDRNYIVYAWRDFVGHYSGLALSCAEDKLRAVSAVARKIHRYTREGYCAGIWTEHVPELLLWEPCERETGETGSKQAEKAPGCSAIAPSWSWAAFHSRVYFNKSGGVINMQCLQVSSVNKIPGDPFSDVVRAVLKVRTGAVCGTIDGSGFIDGSPFGLEEGLSYLLDDGNNTAPESDVVFASVSYRDGLVLKLHSKNDTAYRRIGVYSVVGNYVDFDMWNEMDIDII